MLERVGRERWIGAAWGTLFTAVLAILIVVGSRNLRIRSATTAAFSTFSAFIVRGLIPLLPFVLPVPHPFAVSVVMTLVVFFAVGSARSRWLAMSW